MTVLSSLALCLGLCLAAVTTATAPAPEAPAPAGPLLEALSFVPPDAGLASVAFTHWEGLKAQHGGLDVNSDSEVTDRQDLLVRIAASEAPMQSLDPEHLPSWPAAWGWDATDLEWQLSLSADDGMPATTILRFRDGWDPGPFASHLERHGFVRFDEPGSVTYAPGPQAWYRPGEELERLVSPSSTEAPEAPSTVPLSQPHVGLTLAEDGRTVIVERDGDGRVFAEQAMRSDPVAVAQSPFGRVAANLGDPLAALILTGEDACSGTGAENGLLRGKAARLARSVGQLRPYEALGVGYHRPVEGGGFVGRYVFDYARPRQAERDLGGRRMLLEQRVTTDGRRTTRDVDITLEGAEAVGHGLLLDIRSASDPPVALFDGLRGGQPLFAVCGPLPSDVPLPRRPMPDVPLFAGPATLTLSGEGGIHAWDEIHFGADEVKVQATVTAGRYPCSARLVIGNDADDAAGGGTEALDASPDGAFAVAPGTTARHEAALVVDYATASLRVDSSCPAWSLRIEPVDDPNLPYTLAERFYPVRGATMAELVPQTYHVEDEWAAYARWNTSWQFEQQEWESACAVASGSSRLTADVIYPRWRQPDSVDPAVVTSWEGFIDSLTTHELGHITIALQGADAVDELLDGGFSAPTCAAVERLANRAASRLYARYDRLNDRYDRETDHGNTQGTGLP